MSQDQPDYCLPTLGPISKDSRVEWRSELRNDNDIINGTTPPHNELATSWKGKFFPRGCRGKIERFEIYCLEAFASTITLAFSPEPGMGEIGTVTITPGLDWAWQSANWRQFWNYDSLFIWVKSYTGAPRYAYDTLTLYDAHTSDATIRDWQRENRRYFIRVVYDSETPGDVPVSGTINNVEIKAVSTIRPYALAVLPDNVETTLIQIDGVGETEYLDFFVAAGGGSELVMMMVYVDEVMVFYWQFAALNARGFMASTPGISLISYAVNGQCVAHLTVKFRFRRNLRLRMKCWPGNVGLTVWTEGLVHIMR